MNLIYLTDESGDTGYTKKSSNYFMVVTISCDNIGLLRTIAKNTQRKKKHNIEKNGLHAYSETSQIKNKLTRLLKDKAIICTVFIINKHKLHVKDPYAYVLTKLAKYLSKNKETISIIIARRDTRKVYNQNIVNLFQLHNISATFSSPLKEKALQIADFYSWSVFSHFEKQESEFFQKLKHQITVI